MAGSRSGHGRDKWEASTGVASVHHCLLLSGLGGFQQMVVSLAEGRAQVPFAVVEFDVVGDMHVNISRTDLDFLTQKVGQRLEMVLWESLSQ